MDWKSLCRLWRTHSWENMEIDCELFVTPSPQPVLCLQEAGCSSCLMFVILPPLTQITLLFIQQVFRQCLLWSTSYFRYCGAAINRTKSLPSHSLYSWRIQTVINTSPLRNLSSPNSLRMSQVHCLYFPIMPNTQFSTLHMCIVYLIIIIWLMSVLIGCQLHEGSEDLVLLFRALLYF